MYVVSRFSSNFKAFDSELVETLDEMVVVASGVDQMDIITAKEC